MLRESLLRVLNEYEEESRKPFKENPLGAFLRHDFPDVVRKNGYFNEEYKVKGSSGAGLWAEIPWLVILDREITDTPESGYYVCYLFDADMAGVHLSLNQGWVQYEEKFENKMNVAREEIKKVTSFLQRSLHSAGDFSFTSIDLRAKNNLGRGYALGHICGKYYLKDAIPNDAELFNDLRNLIGVYRELKGMTGANILNLPVDNVVPETLELMENSFSPVTQIEEMILRPVPAQEKKEYASNKEMIFDEEKQLEKNKRNKRVGDWAEKFVYDAEVLRLIKLGKPELAKNVKIVSKDMALGYDILSYEEDGVEKYIEVKGSTTDLMGFFLSEHELEMSKRLRNYYLYVVHHVGKRDASIMFVRHPEFESKLFLLEPRSYLVKYSHKSF